MVLKEVWYLYTAKFYGLLIEKQACEVPMSVQKRKGVVTIQLGTGVHYWYLITLQAHQSCSNWSYCFSISRLCNDPLCNLTCIQVRCLLAVAQCTSTAYGDLNKGIPSMFRPAGPLNSSRMYSIANALSCRKT